MKSLHLRGIAVICLGIVFSVALVWTTECDLREPARADSLTTTATSAAASHTQRSVAANPITATPTFTSFLPVIFCPFVWKSDFENGFDEWGSVHRQGGTTAVVPDPTPRGRGLVQRSTIGGGTPPVEEQPGAWVYRLYPDRYFSYKPAPCEVQEDVWVSKELIETATEGENLVVVGPDIFDKTPEDGGAWHSALQAALVKESVADGRVYLRLVHRPPGLLAPVESGAPEFTSDNWHTVRISIDQDRGVSLYQDGALVARGKPSDDSRSGVVGGHPGLYAYNWHQFSPPLAGTLLVDNYQITCW